MTDNNVVERWNVLDAAGMAVSVQGLLYRALNGKPKPFDFDEMIQRGIEFLDEAKNAGSIVCGNAQVSGFNGTLSPLSWSTDACIKIEFQSEQPESEGDTVYDRYDELVRELEQYQTVLKTLQESGMSSGLRTQAGRTYEFFGALADVLMIEADPVTRTYSHEVR